MIGVGGGFASSKCALMLQSGHRYCSRCLTRLHARTTLCAVDMLCQKRVQHVCSYVTGCDSHLVRTVDLYFCGRGALGREKVNYAWGFVERDWL